MILADRLAYELQRSESDTRYLSVGLLREVRSTVISSRTPRESNWQSRARLHDNGFLKLVLVDEDEWANPELAGFKLVLHVWDDLTETGLYENVHNHRWPFWSVLVCGQLNWEHYCVSDTANTEISHSAYIYRSPGHGSSYTLTPQGGIALDLRMKAVVSPGTCLAMSDTELHRVTRVGEATAATVFLQGPQSRLSTNVYTEVTPDTPTATSSIPPPLQRRALRRAPIGILNELLHRTLTGAADMGDSILQ